MGTMHFPGKKKADQYTPEGPFVKAFNSEADAGRELGYTGESIREKTMAKEPYWRDHDKPFSTIALNGICVITSSECTRPHKKRSSKAP